MSESQLMSFLVDEMYTAFCYNSLSGTAGMPIALSVFFCLLSTNLENKFLANVTAV
jgi:hypothetical protein